MAKGVEDTAFYRWLRLTALNEVGGDPAHLGVPPEELHAWCGRSCSATGPTAMTTLSTHDTKRSRGRPGPAGRARRAAAGVGPTQVAGWRAATAAYRARRCSTPTPSTCSGRPWSAPGRSTRGRLTAYLEKATREAKLHTTWTEPDAAYDDAVRDFAEQVLADAERAWPRVAAFVDRLAPAVAGQRARPEAACS